MFLDPTLTLDRELLRVRPPCDHITPDPDDRVSHLVIRAPNPAAQSASMDTGAMPTTGDIVKSAAGTGATPTDAAKDLKVGWPHGSRRPSRWT